MSEGNEIFALADELAGGQPQASTSDEAEAVHQPVAEGTTVPMTGEREFRVQGHLQDDTNRLNLRLRILQPDGKPLPHDCTLQCYALQYLFPRSILRHAAQWSLACSSCRVCHCTVKATQAMHGAQQVLSPLFQQTVERQCVHLSGHRLQARQRWSNLIMTLPRTPP